MKDAAPQEYMFRAKKLSEAEKCEAIKRLNNDVDMAKEILFYALKQLEYEIEKERKADNFVMADVLETKYSYWKQLMAVHT